MITQTALHAGKIGCAFAFEKIWGMMMLFVKRMRVILSKLELLIISIWEEEN